MADAETRSLKRQRNIILAVLIVVAAAAWSMLVWQQTSMDMAMNTPTMGMHAPLFLALWVAMMAAMMFPTAAPMILTYHKVQAGKGRGGEAFVTTWIFVAAYLLVWSISGVAAYAGALFAEALAQRIAVSPPTAARVGGAMLIAAGLYQLTPLKNFCLAKCRTPIGFIMTSWRDGTMGALRMGLEHGLFCLGCCWLLFLILFPLGVMNIGAMAAVTLLIFAEKTLPVGAGIAKTAGIALVVYGIAVLVFPQALPTFMAPGEMNMD
jgi:predicted metal-binding membrane protein